MGRGLSSREKQLSTWPRKIGRVSRLLSPGVLFTNEIGGKGKKEREKQGRENTCIVESNGQSKTTWRNQDEDAPIQDGLKGQNKKIKKQSGSHKIRIQKLGTVSRKKKSMIKERLLERKLRRLPKPLRVGQAKSGRRLPTEPSKATGKK